MKPPHPKVALVVTMLAVASACSPSADPATPAVTVTDSSGIPVWTYDHTDENLETWSVDPTPVLHLGSLEGDTPDVFGRISSVAIGPGGGVLAADALAGEVRSFSASGAHLVSFGGRGEGPGELSERISILGVSGDSVWTWDQSQQRVSTFADGAFVTSLRTPGGLVLSRVARVGSRVYGQSSVRLAPPLATGMGRRPAQFTVVEQDGTWTHLFEVAGHETFLDIQLSNGAISSVNVVRAPFARGPFFGVVASGANTRIIGGPNDRFVLHQWSADGQVRGVHRYPGLDRPVTDAVIARARQRIMDRYDEPTATMNRELAAFESHVPEYLPAFDRVRDDGAGRLWLRRWVEDRFEEWLILSLEDLLPVARIALPEGFTLLDVRDGLLGGRWLDDVDVAHVRLYRLHGS